MLKRELRRKIDREKEEDCFWMKQSRRRAKLPKVAGMELQHIFLFTAIASSLLILLQSSWTNMTSPPGGALIVLVVSGIAWLVARPIAGYIAAVLWCAFLLLPAILRQRARSRAMGFHRPRRSRLNVSPAVLGLIGLNILFFTVEILAGGPSNPVTLYRLGELDTISVIHAHHYWRLLTALFLHYGVVHLVFNMFALLVLGPPLERQIGGFLFVSSYLLSGLSSSMVVVLLTKLRVLSPLQLVGASGCVMGIVGTWAGFLLRHWRTPFAPQRLRSIAVIIVFQVAFDMVTPDVSMSAHLGGVVTGFLIGLALPSRQARGM